MELRHQSSQTNPIIRAIIAARLLNMNEEIRRGSPEKYFGREIFDVTPVILGGNPADASNKSLLTRVQHMKVVVYWNRFIRNMQQVTGETHRET